MSGRRSKVWEAFQELKVGDLGRRVRCILSVDEYGPEECGHEYQLNDNSTGLMKFHIEKKHPEEFQRLFGEKIATFSSTSKSRKVNKFVLVKSFVINVCRLKLDTID